MRAVVYGHDFTILGGEHHVDWFKEQIRDVYEIDFQATLGAHEGDPKLKWRHDGIYMEADPRHLHGDYCTASGLRGHRACSSAE